MGFNYDLLMEDIYGLEQFWKGNKKVFKELENNFEGNYKVKYVDLLFNFYHSLYEFSSIYSDNFDVDDEDDIEKLLNNIYRFVVSYSKIIQFFEFVEVEFPYYIWSNFNNWKNKRLELMNSL